MFDDTPVTPRRSYNRSAMHLTQQQVLHGRRLTIAKAQSIVLHMLLLLGIAKDAMFHVPKHPVNQVVSLIASNRSQLQGIRPAGPQSSTSGAQPQLPNLPVAPPPLLAEKHEKLESGQVVSLGPTNE